MARKRISATLKSHRVDEFIRYLEDLRKRFGEEIPESEALGLLKKVSQAEKLVKEIK